MQVEPPASVEGISSNASYDSLDSSSSLINSKSKVGAPSASGLTFSFPFNALLNAGSRAVEAFVRPALVVTAGRPISHGFDMRSCTFFLRMAPFEESPPKNAPTEIFLPEYFFRHSEPDIRTSSGRWELHRAEQVLQWWHSGVGEQTIQILSEYKREGVVGVTNSSETWYWKGNCTIM